MGQLSTKWNERWEFSFVSLPGRLAEHRCCGSCGPGVLLSSVIPVGVMPRVPDALQGLPYNEKLNTFCDKRRLEILALKW